MIWPLFTEKNLTARVKLKVVIVPWVQMIPYQHITCPELKIHYMSN